MAVPKRKHLTKEVSFMAVPKCKVSKARRDKRRSAVWKLDAPAMTTCDHCGAYKAPHKVCKSCGYYKGVAVLKMDAE